MQTLGKISFLFFLENSLPRALTIALGKELFCIFFWEIICRGLWPKPSAKTWLLFVFWISLPRAMVKALGKDQRNFKFFCLFIFIQTKDRYIYIYHHTESTTSTYISRTSHIYTTNIMYVHLVVHKFTKSNQSSKPPTRTQAARTHHPPQPSCLCVEGGVSKAPGSGDVRGGLLDLAVD